MKLKFMTIALLIAAPAFAAAPPIGREGRGDVKQCEELAKAYQEAVNSEQNLLNHYLKAKEHTNTLLNALEMTTCQIPTIKISPYAETVGTELAVAITPSIKDEMQKRETELKEKWDEIKAAAEKAASSVGAAARFGGPSQ